MTTVNVRDSEYTVSALTLGDLRTLTKEGHLKALTTISGTILNAEQVEATIACIAASFSKKHPECTRDWVADNLDVADSAPCLRAVLKASGFLPGEGPKPQSP